MGLYRLLSITILLALFLAAPALAACNETRVIIYANESLKDYNETIIIENCQPEYNNFSFFGVLMVFMFFIAIVSVAIFNAKKVWIKTCLVLLGTILTMSLTRFAGWFVEITNPQETILITTLQNFFAWSVWALYFVIFACIGVLLILALNALVNHKKKRWKDSWEDWGNE